MSLFLGSPTSQVDTSPANELILELRNAKMKIVPRQVYGETKKILQDWEHGYWKIPNLC